MSDLDHLELDGHALQLFLAVLEEGSVTAAATRLGVTQSAVSHGLGKLRRVVNDPLFVKSGRGIVATAHAHALRDQARLLLDGMKSFAQGARFEPGRARLALVVAANDFQRDLLLPGLFRRLDGVLAGFSLRVVPSGLPTPDLMREGRCDLLLSPFPPTGTDIFQKRLFTDRYACFFDPACRGPVTDWADYQAARHVTVVYPDNEKLGFDRQLAEAGLARAIAVSVPSFAGVPAFLRGTAMLATLPGLYADHLTSEFARCALPSPPAQAPRELGTLPMYMAWHRRFQDDPAHVWLRGQVIEQAAGVAARACQPARGVV